MNRKTRWIPAWLVLGALVAICGTASGIDDSHLGPFGIPLVIDNDTLIDVNNIAMFVTNSGGFARDLESPGGPSGLFFPKGTDKTAVYACGLWFGATVGGDVRVTVAEYSLEYSPGRIYPDGTWDDAADERLKVYKVNRGDTNANPDYANWPVDDGAPVDENGNPAILGDQMLWAVYNDADPLPHSNDAGNSDPLGIEIRQSTFAFERPEDTPLGNTVFVKFNIYNKGTDTLEDCYVSLWSDPDLGGAGDDLVGCDTLLSLGYCYNDTNDDEIYKKAPPAVGYDFFQGPIIPSLGDTAFVSGIAVPDFANLPMTSFNKYINGTDPDSRFASYNYMRGLDRDGSELHQFGDPELPVTKFFVSGDPVTGSGWLDDNAADRRLMLSSGPFTMAPGDSQEVIVAVLVAQASDRLSSLTLLKLYDQAAQTVFDNNFEVPPTPPAPELYLREFDGAIDLTWSTTAVDWSDVSPGKWNIHHQGYNVYQGESIAGPWKKIATYDVEDTLSAIYRDVIVTDEQGNVNVVRDLYQTGANTGLSHNLRVKTDQILGGPFVNFSEYYFAVTSYAVDAQGLEPFFVGGNLVGYVQKTAETESTRGGTIATPKASTAVLEQMADHSSGVSDGGVTVHYMVQEEIVEHDYQVVFKENPDEEEAEAIPILWDLIDTTDGTTVLENQTGQAEGLEFPVITNGFIADVFGPPLVVKDWDWGGDGPRWLSWVDWGGSGFNGAVGLGFEFFGSTLAPGDYGKDIELRFTENEAEWSDCATYRRDDGYSYRAGGRFPGQAYDVTGGIERRLNLCFVENSTDEKPADLIWNPDDSDVGGREYLFIMNSDYNGAADYNAENDGTEADVVFAGWLRLRGSSHPWLESPGPFILQGNRINTPNDVFEFTTYPAGMSVGTVIDNDLKKIRVVPNPYLNQSAYELNQFDRIVRFINLPNTETTVRIFTLSGELVRTVTKEDAGSSVLTWDLENEQSIPVASGVYIYHVDARGIGTEVGKMVVFIEKERLNRF